MQMNELNDWLAQFKDKLLAKFGDELEFIGIQGNRARGDAKLESDIDVVVIFKEMTFEKLTAYEVVTHTKPNRHLLWGFVSGIEELLVWDKSDLFIFVYDTKPLYGSLEFLKQQIQTEDIERFVREGQGGFIMVPYTIFCI